MLSNRYVQRGCHDYQEVHNERSKVDSATGMCNNMIHYLLHIGTIVYICIESVNAELWKNPYEEESL